MTETLSGSIPDDSFFSYKKDSNKFEVTRTEDLSFVDNYAMEITAVIEVPISATST